MKNDNEDQLISVLEPNEYKNFFFKFKDGTLQKIFI